MPRPETHMHKQKFYKFYTVHYAFNEYSPSAHVFLHESILVFEAGCKNLSGLA